MGNTLMHHRLAIAGVKMPGMKLSWRKGMNKLKNTTREERAGRKLQAEARQGMKRLTTLVVLPLLWMSTSPVLKSSTVEFYNYQKIFVRHFASQSILTKGVLAKYRYFLWNWTPSHIQRIYKGRNSENPLWAITFDWSVLRT